jgi:hypothetical protein
MQLLRLALGILALTISLGWAASASAEPTPVNRSVSWTHSGAGIDGFYLYWAPQSENPKVYSNARRFQIPSPAARSAVILDMKPDATGGLCFKGTAYLGTAESAYSNEACGNFGMEGMGVLGLDPPPAP